jgi:hypothetical protein
LYHILDTIRLIQEKFFLIVPITGAKMDWELVIRTGAVDIYPFLMTLLYKFFENIMTKIEKKCPDSAIFIIRMTKFPI